MTITLDDSDDRARPPEVSVKANSLPDTRSLFAGQTAITTTDKPGAFLELEAHMPLQWLPVANVTMHTYGRFRYRCRRSPLTIGCSFAFRAATPGVAGYWQGEASLVNEATVQK